MSEPFNSQAPHFLTKVKTYCNKVLPLVFDNSLSYYETLCHFTNKLNEIIKTVNAQNLNIIEFTHMIEVEIEKFEAYIENRMDEYENELKKQWEEFKAELNQAWEDYKTEINQQWKEYQDKINGEWDNEKRINEEFRNKLLTEWETFSEELKRDQNNFENHMVQLFNDFTSDESTARTEFEKTFQQLFEQWKVDTLNALNNGINTWESNTQTTLLQYIDRQMTEYQNTIIQQLNKSDEKFTKEIEQEKTLRESADTNLQTQINQLTPEGSIKADNINADGNTQLYIVDNDTQQRQDIFPIVKNNDNNGNITYLNRENGVAVNTAYFYIENSVNSFIIGNNNNLTPDTFIDDGILIPKNLIKNLGEYDTPAKALLSLSITLTQITNTISNAIFMLVLGNNVKFVNYNDVDYLSIPLLLKANFNDNSASIGTGRLRYMISITAS